MSKSKTSENRKPRIATLKRASPKGRRSRANAGNCGRAAKHRREASPEKTNARRRNPKTPDRAATSGPKRSESKQSTILALLKQPRGATIETISKETGWQPHSIRGFFSAAIRKKLGLSLKSEKRDGVRCYRIDEPRPQKAASRPKSTHSAEAAGSPTL